MPAKITTGNVVKRMQNIVRVTYNFDVTVLHPMSLSFEVICPNPRGIFPVARRGDTFNCGMKR